ncbi:ectoine/hydroxyectoine ABC transporter permease subunit EhuC, partial [Streptomyces sp. NPDC058672]
TTESAEIYTISLVIYFVLAFLLTRGMRSLERKTKAGIGQQPEPRGGLMGKLNFRQQLATSQVPKSSGGGGA